jgi:glycosyltransferase involved in cell wall biosynthesis
LKKENYSIIHGNSINHLLFLLFKNKKINYITTVHNTYLQRLEAKKESLLHKIIYPIFIKIEEIVLNKSDKIIAVSRNTKNYIYKLTKNKNVFVIENGVDTNIYKPVKKDNNFFRFLYVGRIEKRKRVLDTVKLFSSLLNQYQGPKMIEFIIVGDGPEYDKINKFIKENNIKQIKLVGFSSKVKQYYDQANCLLLLSRGEGLPLALLEAISCGLSVIVTRDASGLSEIVKQGENGYIVDDILNKEEIINKMNDIIDNSDIFSAKSKSIAKNYDWSIIINKYLKVYNYKEI